MYSTQPRSIAITNRLYACDIDCRYCGICGFHRPSTPYEHSFLPATTSYHRNCDLTLPDLSVAGNNARGSRLAETDQRLTTINNGAGGSTDDCCRWNVDARQFLKEKKNTAGSSSCSISYGTNCRIRWHGDNAQHLHSLLASRRRDTSTVSATSRTFSTSKAVSEEARTKSMITAALKHLGSMQAFTRRGTRLFHRKSNTTLRLMSG